MGPKNPPVAVATATASARLKREDCRRTRHDSAFSGWKVLVGPSDWEDYSLGKEGAERYRVHNLPKSSTPGVYELGVAVFHAKSGREITKLDPSYIVVVYLGQADCVRTRLQQYGRSGAHLASGSSNSCPNNCKSSCSHKQLGLFEEILFRGCSVVFRWAPMTNKGDALRTEALLLNTFDYAWNKGSNGVRRPCDILQKLDEVSSGAYRISSITRKFLPFLHKKVGIRIKGRSASVEKKDDSHADEESNFFTGIFKLSRSHPRVVLDRSGVDEDSANLCGVSLGNGNMCTRPPVKGRKRCSEHKGMKVTARLRSQIPCEKDSDDHCASEISYYVQNIPLFSGDFPAEESFSPVCGFILEDGTSCKSHPAQGRKRCTVHKGQRIRRSHQVSRKPEESNHLDHVESNSKLSDTFDVRKLENQVFPEQCHAKDNDVSVCGVEYDDGTFCTRQPARGRVRCESHKGMRVNHVKKYAVTT